MKRDLSYLIQGLAGKNTDEMTVDEVTNLSYYKYLVGAPEEETVSMYKVFQDRLSSQARAAGRGHLTYVRRNPTEQLERYQQ